MTLIALGIYIIIVQRGLPDPNLAAHPALPEATVVLAADGQELGRFFRENRRWVRYSDIATPVVHALIATEDHRFFEHSGVDIRRLAGAAWRTVRRDVQGGSTLTMQLARNRFKEIGNEMTVHRKLQEILLAFRIERAYSKRQILEAYLNTVPFGYNTFGIEAAATLYFDKTAKDLDANEAATLIGVLKGTSHYNPVRHPERALSRRDVVVRRMADVGFLTADEAGRLRQQPIYLDFQPDMLGRGDAPYFLEYVRRSLEQWAAARGYDIYGDGLRVHTTLDSELQEAAEAALEQQARGLQLVAAYEWSSSRAGLLSTSAADYPEGHTFSYLWRRHPDLIDEHIRRTRAFQERVRRGADPLVVAAQLKGHPAFLDSLRQAVTQLQAGLVAVDPSNGHVKVWVGGRDFERDQFDKVSLARRQPGSTFKPFVYAAALEAGLSPWHVVQDSAMAYNVGGRKWQPHNAGGGYSGRMMTLHEALVQSKNTITAQLVDWLGPARVRDVAQRSGIESELRAVPSLGLGTSEVTLLELVGAYTTFANHGRHVPPVAITRIEDSSGRVVAQFAPNPVPALSRRTADGILDMLRGVTKAGGTGSRIRAYAGAGADIAAKTGTTQNGADGWFVLMHPELIAGAWVGFNDQRITFRTNFWGQGGHNALHVIGDFVRRAQGADLAFDPQDQFRIPRLTPPNALLFAEDRDNPPAAVRRVSTGDRRLSW